MSKKAFLFSGQGAQFVGMGKDLYDNFDIAKKYFDEAENILNKPIKKIIFEGPEETLKKTENTQPAVMLMSYIAYKILESEGITADAFAGFSLGEYSALTAAGILSFEDGMNIIKQRGLIMDEQSRKVDGAMAAIIGLEPEQVEEICKKAGGTIVPANYNSPSQTVVSGERAAVEKACALADEAEAMKTVMLNVSGPFHSPLLEPAADKLRAALDTVKFNPIGSVKILSNVTADYHSDAALKDMLVKQMYSPVRWTKTIEKLAADGCEVFIEVGPGKTLTGLMKQIDRSKKAYAGGTLDAINKIIAEQK
ncbi:MAG: ACP S-malonyltransferase [Spirochaetales bacterium]|nr:ACP S-malonyltransferase [Spirochaetales bacterium]